MKPIDARNATWEEIVTHVEKERRQVYEAMLKNTQPRTVREIADGLGCELSSVAPRITELYQLGLVRFVDRDGRRGRYQAVPLHEAREAHRAAQANGGQLLMSFGT